MVVWNDFRNDARVLKEAQTLQSAGYQVVVHAVHVPGITATREVLVDGIDVRRALTSPFGRRAKGQAGAEAVKIGRYGVVLAQMLARCWWHATVFFRLVFARATVIHAHDVNVLPTAWLAARLSRALLVYDAHEVSTSREGYAGVRKLVGWLESRLMPQAAATITTTGARARFFARAYRVSRPLVLQNRPRLQPVTASSRLRNELGLDKPWPIVLYQGGLQAGRGLELLLRTASEVPQAYFVYIGGGRLSERLSELCAELGLGQRVRFIPTVPLAELPSYTASADIGVQPIENTCLNHFTTDSNKLFEYVQAGLAVVASDLPEIRRVVVEHDLGLLVPPGDTEALASALRRLVEDVQLRGHYAACSRKAAAILNWESQEHLLLELYEQVLSGGSRVDK